jgi:hypothetical protein
MQPHHHWAPLLAAILSPDARWRSRAKEGDFAQRFGVGVKQKKVKQAFVILRTLPQG